MPDPTFIRHPKRVSVNGYVFEIWSREPLTDEQAGKVAQIKFRNMRLKKKDLDYVIEVMWTDSAAFLDTL